METTLEKTINNYIDAGHTGKVYSVEDEMSIIVNPSFDILPNHLYKSPLVAAVYCRGGHGRGRVNAKTYNIEQGDSSSFCQDRLPRWWIYRQISMLYMY